MGANIIIYRNNRVLNYCIFTQTKNIMVNKEIKLLESQIENLDAANFDFEAWKKYSILILSRIFGGDSDKIKQLQEIDFEFTSWSLRDASGNESYEEGSKRLAKEIVQSAIDELHIYGMPVNNNENSKSDTLLSDILNIITDEFKGSQVKKLSKILLSDNSEIEKRRKVKELIEDIGKNNCYDIITNVLIYSDMSKAITNKK